MNEQEKENVIRLLTSNEKDSVVLALNLMRLTFEMNIHQICTFIIEECIGIDITSAKHENTATLLVYVQNQINFEVSVYGNNKNYDNYIFMSNVLIDYLKKELTTQ